MQISYRFPDTADIDALAELGRRTFVETFEDLYEPEDLQSFLDATYSPEAVASDLANPAMQYRVAEDADGALIGYCKIYDGVSLDYDPGDKKVMELKQLYVLEDYQGRGVAHDLMQWALDQADGLQADEILLSVFSENIRAQRFYKKRGFFHIGDTIFMVGNQADHEFLYLKTMKNN